jgi:hypothetical protein
MLNSFLLAAALSVFLLPFNDGAISGVEGKAAFFDGINSRIVIPAADVPQPERGFVLDVWVCPVAFPKSPCPIACRQNNEYPDGWSLWLDNRGYVHFQVALAGEWFSAESSVAIELRQWSRITAIFHNGSAIRLAIDGKEVAKTAMELPGLKVSQYPLWIGRTPKRTPSFLENQSIPIYSSFDGAIDEFRISGDKALYKKILAEKFVRPVPPEFEQRRLPSGPSELAFGAWYIPLKYYKAWDEQWRGETPDVVVGFGPEKPFKVVFWRGISYAPCFVTEKDNWMSNEFIERQKVTGWGCPESMSDKHADFSSVRILENTPARTVILWRNAPVGVNQKFPYQSEETQWGDWSEETYIFYPDGHGVRKMDLWSSDLDSWYEWCQSLQVLHPDQRPEDVLDASRIMSVAAMDGRSKTFGWDFSGTPRQTEASIPGANIQVTYLKSVWNPYLILDDRPGLNENKGDGPEIVRYAGRWSEYSDFPWRNHWPVAQDYVIGRYAAVADAPSHTYTSTQYNAPFYKDSKKMTKLMMCGCTDGDAVDLLPLAKSWLRAPKMYCGGSEVKYDITQRAYVLDAPASLSLKLEASAENPVCGLCLIVKKWEDGDVSSVLVNGAPAAFKAGRHQSWEGETLILWMDIKAEAPISLSVE